MNPFSSWFFNSERIHEEAKTTEEKLVLVKKLAPYFAAGAVVLWVTFLAGLFTLIVTVRAAVGVPLF